MNRVIGGALALAALVAGVPAGADVKAGVDAWGRGDFARAVTEWRPLAIAGDADAQFNLAQAYKLGHGVPIDPVQAQDWFRRAADQGHVQAQDNYGIGLYQSGRRAEAASWLERSVARGEPRAQLVLGTMLFNGDGVKTDYPRAYALMTRASQAGLPSASQSLAQMDDFISAADREHGLQLAQQYAAQKQVVAADLPPPADPAPGPSAKRPTAPAAPRPAALRPAPAVPPVGGAWRIQLGAFRDRGNAEGLWARVRPKLGGAAPAYVAGGGVTRLQATGFATKAAATRACTASGVPCTVISP